MALGIQRFCFVIRMQVKILRSKVISFLLDVGLPRNISAFQNFINVVAS